MLVQSLAEKRSKCQINVRSREIIHGQRIFTESLNFDLKFSKKSIVNERKQKQS